MVPPQHQAPPRRPAPPPPLSSPLPAPYAPYAPGREKQCVMHELISIRYSRMVESTVLLEEPESPNAELLQEEVAEAKAEPDKREPGLTMFTDGSRLDNGAARYSVVGKIDQS